MKEWGFKENPEMAFKFASTKIESFTPSLKGVTSDPALGNSIVKAAKSRMGSYLRILVSIKFGGTATFGSGHWYFQLPDSLSAAALIVATGANQMQVVGSVYFNDDGTSFHPGVCYIDPAQPTRIYMQSSLAGAIGNHVSEANPHVWAANDVLSIEALIPIEGWL